VSDAEEAGGCRGSKPNRDAQSRDGILQDALLRRRIGFGTAFLPGNHWLERAYVPTDVLPYARDSILLGAA